MAAADPTIYDNAYDRFAERPELQESIGLRAIKRMRQPAGEILAVDHTAARKEMKAGVALALALCLSETLRKNCPESRIGIMLPPGIGGMLANLGVIFAGKTAVNINFTLAENALNSCLRQAKLTTIITAEKMQELVAERFEAFPWPETIIDIKSALLGIPKPKILLKLALIRTLPASMIADCHKIDRRGGDREAAILFTSGSDTEPKGVILTHRNLIANATQIHDCGIIPDQTRLMSNLPIFHSFGFTVQIWAITLYHSRAVYFPSPLDWKKTCDIVEREQCEILLGTPTFFRPYLKRAEPQKLACVTKTVAGAEKTPDGFHEAWESRFPNSRYLEGFGQTEASPVVSVNTLAENRRGSVGKLFPGMQARVRHVDTGELLPIGETGVIELRGPNIFLGYLNQPELTEKAKDADDWLNTGDLGRIDPEGFLYIEGRLSRFSKIGGEMIPHGAVEEAIAAALKLDTSEEPKVAVASRQDPAKGEALVLLSCVDLTAEKLRELLKPVGLSNLWIPKLILRVEAIPTLASGKLDLKRLRQLAQAE